MLNVAFFGKTAKEWRDKNSGKAGNIRDYSSIEQLVCLSNLESLNAEFTPTPIMFYLYVTISKVDGDLYIGSTNDLRERLKDHNAGKVFSTKLRRPLELIYYEAYKSEKDARKREHNLKLRSRAFAQLKKRIINSLL